MNDFFICFSLFHPKHVILSFIDMEDKKIGNDPAVMWQRCPGTMYLARANYQSEWMLARFDYIELDRCPTQKQGKYPDKRSLYPFFLFGQKDNKCRIWTR